MSTIEKLIEKAKGNPNSIRFTELDRILRHKGYDEERQRGSHVCYRNKQGEVIVIPKRDSVKEAYINEILERLKL